MKSNTGLVIRGINPPSFLTFDFLRFRLCLKHAQQEMLSAVFSAPMSKPAQPPSRKRSPVQVCRI